MFMRGHPDEFAMSAWEGRTRWFKCNSVGEKTWQDTWSEALTSTLKCNCVTHSFLQAIVLLIPAFLLIGWAANVTLLSVGLLLYSFGELNCPEF